MSRWMMWLVALVVLGGMVVTAGANQFAASAADSRDSGDATPATVIAPYEQSVTVPADGEDLRVTFAEVVQDPRCPSNAICVQAGEVVIALLVQGGSLDAPEVVWLRLASAPDGETVQVASVEIQLQDVQPYPQEPNLAVDSGYRAILRVAPLEG